MINPISLEDIRAARGRIADLDVSDAQRAPGVLKVMTHLDAPRLPMGGRAAVNPPAGRVLSLLQDNVVHYNGQPIAVVVADTPEHSAAAACVGRASFIAGAVIRYFDRAKA